MQDEGASLKERALEAARRDNTELLNEVLDEVRQAAGKSRGQKPEAEIAKLLNTVRDPIGLGVLHLAAGNGNYEVLDLLLDQEGLEIDELDRLQKETPLHKAVQFNNAGDVDMGFHIVEILLDAGCDPRIRNKDKLKPIDLVDRRNQKLRVLLQKAEYAMQVGDDVVQDDDEDDGGSGSESN